VTPFVLSAVAMVALALVWVIVPLLRRGRPGTTSEHSNVAILRDQLRELDADLATGTMPRDRYDQAKRELEERAIEESRQVGGAPTRPSHSAAWTAAIIAGAIPISALLLYVALGNPEAIAPIGARTAKSGAEHEVTPQEVEAMAAKLAARLQNEPDNADGWVMLARTYYALNRHAEAARAFDRAVAIIPGNADLLADYADALGAAEGGLSGKSLELVERALKVDPTHWKALALAGTAAFNRKDYKLAVAYWERMKATVPAGSPIAGSIDASIAEARELGGLKAAAVPPAATAASPVATVQASGAVSPKASGSAAPAPPGATVGGTVTLAPALAARVTPTDTVYIFARAAEGPRMPLAILRKQVKDLPVSFAFDDSMAMTPDFALSKFPSVIVGARVSKSGSATPQSGDLEGLSTAVKLGATGLSVVIDRALP
jgi:cytochrome c-type biogenesis protein CcmH